MTKKEIIDRLDEIDTMVLDTKEALEDLINDVDLASEDLEERESASTNAKISEAMEILESVKDNLEEQKEAVQEALDLLTE